jgi:hypothetical protein
MFTASEAYTGFRSNASNPDPPFADQPGQLVDATADGCYA